MFALLLMLFGTTLTPEQKNLVDRLGDRDFVVRERATKEIIDRKYYGIDLARAAINSDDPEIRMRGEIILSAYFNPPKTISFPSISGFYKMAPLTLPSGMVFNPEELPRLYWERLGGTQVYDSDLLERASINLLRDIRSVGVSWEDIEAIAAAALPLSTYKQFELMVGLDPSEHDEEGP